MPQHLLKRLLDLSCRRKLIIDDIWPRLKVLCGEVLKKKKKRKYFIKNILVT